MTYSEFKERAKQFFRNRLSVTDYIDVLAASGRELFFATTNQPKERTTLIWQKTLPSLSPDNEDGSSGSSPAAPKRLAGAFLQRASTIPRLALDQRSA